MPGLIRMIREPLLAQYRIYAIRANDVGEGR